MTIFSSEHLDFLLTINQIPGWRTVYKFTITFIWFFLAQIELHPDIDAVIKSSITQVLACQWCLQSNWCPEDQTIHLQSLGTETRFIHVHTQFDDLEFKRYFYMAVSIGFILWTCWCHFCRSPPLDPTSSCMHFQQQGISSSIMLRHPPGGMGSSAHSSKTSLAYHWTVPTNSLVGTPVMVFHCYTTIKSVME